MQYQIRHITHYTFSSAVILEPHVLRLRPQEVQGVGVDDFRMAIRPAPAGRFVARDVAGNLVDQVFFSTPDRELRIETAFDCHLGEDNAFGFLIYPFTATRLPFTYPESDSPFTHPYLERSAEARETAAFAHAIMEETGHETLPFLMCLAGALYRRTEHIVREEGAPLPPDETLVSTRGSCRDVAVLFMAACRHVGLAARFVSGYALADKAEQRRHLHAWAEVLLPGAGWIGFDPSCGSAVNNAYVPVAAAANPLEAAPVTGTLRGAGAKSRLSYTVEIHPIETAQQQNQTFG